MKNRDQSLDALRGFAILAMILSGSIAYGGALPAWMYHAQVPPPLHKFVPALPGITWVDLVFPFFLFSMGAAIPLSLSRLEREGATLWKVIGIAARRYVLLTFFALFTQHMRAGVMASNPGTGEQALSVLGFVLLFFQFYDQREKKYKMLFIALKIFAFVLAIFLLYKLPFADGKGFGLTRVDIIILVLANTAFFGTIIWWLTRGQPGIRVGLLLFVMAVFLGSKEKGSWNETLYNYTPVPWLYKFYYLKYLFIILPGTVAGDWLLKDSHTANDESSRNGLVLISFLCFGLIGLNVALLFSRVLVLNLALTTLLLIAIYYKQKSTVPSNFVLNNFFAAGAYLLLVGLFFEAYEGGIHKDFSTYSYYFVTSGLAFFMLIGFYGLKQNKVGAAVTAYLGLNGRNPMVAYVAGNLLLTPFLHLTGAVRLFEAMNGNPWSGFLKGVLFTGIVSLITIFFTKRKWFWKT
ncbi:MAG TPA: DUF5009 domain-containing protein [Flavisolibacter sp.]|nr:DUF5009 domain-containing protein [Flavisolibacter sp.]